MTTATLERADAPTASQAVDPPPQPYKLGDLKAGAFAAVRSDFKNPKDAIDIINFIDFLAQNNSTSADELEMPFLKGDKHEWTLDRAAATKLFFGHMEKQEAEGKKNVILPDAAAQEAIGAAMKARLVDGSRTVKERIRAKKAEADAFMLNVQSCLSQARKLQEEIDAISGMDPAERIKAVVEKLAGTNWNFHKFGGNTLEFISRSDVMLRHIDPKAGFHYELNCGKFRLCVSLSNMQIKVYGHERTAYAEYDCAFIHPHISSTSSICWGNGADTAHEAQVSGDIIKLIQLIDNLLPHYNADSPYIKIEEFKRKLEKRDEREKKKHEEKEKAAKAGATPGATPEAPAAGLDLDILDDEPEFTDDIEWEEGESNDDDSE